MAKKWLVGAGIVAGLIILVATFLFLLTPAAVRLPKLEHAHLRMQVVVSGQPVDFSADSYQSHTPTACTDELASDPIHFHDKKDQYVHLHWKGMTGGLILKNYGLNMVGGLPGMLGVRFDNFKQVPIHGKLLPAVPSGAKAWVYAGDQTRHEAKPLQDFLHQDLETFFNKQSTIQPEQAFWRDLLFAKAKAHGSEVHGDTTDEAERALINNVLGNVVIFIQPNEPTSAEITDRFNKLEPLSLSTCGG